jgi:hypothetical protein
VDLLSFGDQTREAGPEEQTAKDVNGWDRQFPKKGAFMEIFFAEETFKRKPRELGLI